MTNSNVFLLCRAFIPVSVDITPKPSINQDFINTLTFRKHSFSWAVCTSDRKVCCRSNTANQILNRVAKHEILNKKLWANRLGCTIESVWASRTLLPNTTRYLCVTNAPVNPHVKSRKEIRCWESKGERIFSVVCMKSLQIYRVRSLPFHVCFFIIPLPMNFSFQ